VVGYMISRDDGWRMPDWLWQRIEPLLPAPPFHPLGCHRPRVCNRAAMDAILLVLRTGMQWNALSATGVCSSSSAHRRFQEWEQAGVFHEIWRQGLLEYDEVVGIDWSFLSADGAMSKAPLGGRKTGGRTPLIGPIGPNSGGRSSTAGTTDSAAQKTVAICNDGHMPSTLAPTAATPAPGDGIGRDELVDAVLGASRALVAVAARSLANLAEDVTLAQYRVLVELAARGPQRPADLADAMGVERSTATRMCERLVRKQLVHRRRASGDRRSVRVSLAPAGRELVEEVTRRRRAEITRIVRRMPKTDREAVLLALRAFATAAGEVPEQDWSLGWR